MPILKHAEDFVKKEHNTLGFDGRFGPGLPRINDGSLLFLLHMISKMEKSPERGGRGSRIAIVFNGSPLFTGDAGSGESNIRRHIIENDWLECLNTVMGNPFPSGEPLMTVVTVFLLHRSFTINHLISDIIFRVILLEHPVLVSNVNEPLLPC